MLLRWRVLTFACVAAGPIFECMAVTAVVKNISTGIDPATGLKLANNAPDPDYVVAPGSLDYVGQTLIARSDPLPNVYMPDSASAGSRWIAINSGLGLEGISVSEVGAFNFQTTVNLDGFDPSTAVIANAEFAVDDGLVAIQVNGQTVFTTPNGYPENLDHFYPLPASLGAGAFSSGVNTITFDLVNLVPFTPVAFRLESDVTATPLPEPASALIGSAGVGGFLMTRRRVASRD